MNKRFSLFFYIFLFVFLFCGQNTLAENNRTEYQCQPGCNGSVLSRDCWEDCTLFDHDEDDNEYCVEWTPKCNNWQTSQQCQSWQKCDGQTSCYCSGQCISTPINTYPSNGEQNMKPPFNIVWSYTPGAGSYRYKLEGTNQGTINGITTNTFYAPGSCVLKPDSTHYWQVQACCNTNGSDCGSWNEKWNFKTSLSPEPVSPKNNENSATVPVNLDWCDIPSAKSYYIKIYGNNDIIEIPIQKKDGILPSQASFGQEIFTKNTNYYWEMATCLNENLTKCGPSCSSTQEGDVCGDYNQRWLFKTGEITLPPPKIFAPISATGIPIVNFQSFLTWESLGIKGAGSYRYEIKKGSIIVLDTFTKASITTVPFSSFWNLLEFNQDYSWSVKSCWDEEGRECQTEKNQSTFKTTGALPNLQFPAADASDITIPVKFDWNDVPGAASYVYQISSDVNFGSKTANGTTTDSSVSIDYPPLKTKTSYWWKVKTCADIVGNLCGEPTTQKFTIFNLPPPSVSSPQSGGTVFINQIMGWEEVSGAGFYRYKIDYISSAGENNYSCQNLAGQQIVPPTITPSSEIRPTFKCLGEYQWAVQSCLDRDCTEASEWSSAWTFTVSQKIPTSGNIGVVPCGRDFDDPKTPYNERESCQFKHILLLFNNILNIVLWRIGLIVLVLLALGVGAIYYFSMGAADTIKQVNSILKSTLRGYLIIFISWTIINIIMIILGFKVSFFGKWWNISF